MAYYDAAILYAGPDKTIAEILVQKLKELGLSLWWDQDLAAHEQFSLEQMEDVFNRSRQVIALLSEDARRSDWVKRELDLALSLNKTVIPCLVGNEPLNLKRLTAELPDSINRLRLIDLRSRTGPLNHSGVVHLTNLIKDPDLTESLPERQFWPTATHSSYWRALAGIATLSLILGFASYSGQQLSDLLDPPRVSPMNIIYSGLLLCTVGALTSGARQILELVAAWRIMKKLRKLSQNEKTYPSTS